MLLFILIIYVLLNFDAVNCEIGASSDLDCDFTSNCRWRNATDDNGEWMIGSSLEIDSNNKIMPMKNNDEGNFAYSTGFMGRTVAMLVSEVVTCQLGGATLKYWYFQSGEQSQLEVCMRQPPGNRDPMALRCYDGVSSTRAHQWVYRVVELPPASQPFEIILRATYFPPTDVIAIDDIKYNAALCVRRDGPAKLAMQTTPSASSKNSTSRTIRSVPPLIGYRDWQMLKNTEHFKGQTMVIVAQTIVDNLRKNQSEEPHEPLLMETKLNIDRKEGLSTTMIPLPITSKDFTPPTESKNASSTIEATMSTTSTNSPIPANILELTTQAIIETTSLEGSTSSTATTEKSVVSTTTESTTMKSQMATTDNPTANFMNLLKQAAPMLPYIPVLVRTLQSVDPRVQQVTGRGPLDELSEFAKPAGVDLSSLNDFAELRRAPTSNQPVTASHFYNTDSTRTAQQPNQERLVALAKKFGILDEENIATTISPQEMEMPTPVRTNAFGMIQTSTLRSIKIVPTVYPTDLIRSKKMEQLQKHLTETPQTKQNSLKTDEMDKISKLHNNYFSKTSLTTQPPANLVVFKKPTKTESEVATKLTELAHVLPDGALSDLSALKDIPDIDGLTKGMDLTLIRKPGGFAKLKKQFMERFLRRTLGQPFEDAVSTGSEITNDETNAGAGGTPDGALSDLLSALKDIPDIDGLTKGMDLTLIRKPGGFAKLKKQFMERFLRRTMGLPFEDAVSNGSGVLAPPIISVKVTHNKMKERTDGPKKSATNPVVFKKPTKTESEVATKLTELAHVLPDGALSDLSALKDIPDIDGLTKGMDLTLIRKPGGFAKLKKQFMERFLRRTMGLPFEDAVSTGSEITNDGTNAGAGGTFDDYPVTQPPQLIDFSNDRETAFNTNFDSFKSSQDTKLGSRAAGITSFDPSNQPMSFSEPMKEIPPKVEPVPRSGPLFNPLCPLVDCNFDDNTFCNYVTSQSQNKTESLREWAISARSILNSNTGISKDLSKTGSFAYAGGLIVSPEEAFVLSSNIAIEIKEKAQLDFFVYQAGTRGRLRVCLNNLTDCPLELLGKNIDNNARKWKNYGVPIDRGTHAIHFVVDRLFDNYVIGLDNIQLLNKQSTASLKCT